MPPLQERKLPPTFNCTLWLATLLQTPIKNGTEGRMARPVDPGHGSKRNEPGGFAGCQATGPGTGVPRALMEEGAASFDHLVASPVTPRIGTGIDQIDVRRKIFVLRRITARR